MEDNILGVVWLHFNGTAQEGTIYSDGSCRLEDNEVIRLSEYEMEKFKILSMRSDRNLRIQAHAIEVLPINNSDSRPEPYIENLGPLTEDDFKLPSERLHTSDVCIANDKKEVEGCNLALPREEKEVQAKKQRKKKKEKPEKNNKKDKKQEQQANSPRKKGKIALIVLVVAFVIALLASFVYANFMLNGDMDNISSSSGEIHQSSIADESSAEAAPKTQINLTINASPDAEVSGEVEDNSKASESSDSKNSSSNIKIEE